MNWPYRHIVIVAAADQAAANLVAASIDPDDRSETFGVPLSDGSPLATHYGCSTLSNQVMAGAMYATAEAVPPVLPSVQWWRLDMAGLLIDSNTEFGTPGEAWTWLDALAALGLQSVETEVV